MATKKQNYVSPAANKLEKENIKLKAEIELLKSKLKQVQKHSAIEIANEMLASYDDQTDENISYSQSLTSIDDDEHVVYYLVFENGTTFKFSLTKE